MRFVTFATMAGLFLATSSLASAQGSPPAALADAARPEADRARDADRQPAALLAFAGVHSGQRVIELVPGRGYFTRILSAVVGASGAVAAYVPEEMAGAASKPLEAIGAVAAEPGRGNVRVVHAPLAAPLPAEPADVVWTSLNYHDLHNIAAFDAGVFNRHVFEALKPGGVYVVIDHAAAAGAPLAVGRSLHRIDKALVIREIEAAGFVLDGESSVLANPADTHDKPVFDPALRGHTDQFVLRFRKGG